MESEPDAAKRGYKLQEFEAHGSDVNCLNIGKKSCRIFITGGEDRVVNLWAIGKPTSLLSLSGHTSSVQSVTFDSAEVLVLAGSSNGTIKLWDLEEAKLVRTITGHRSNSTAVEFHPFGEFFASGSLDTDLKIWDIRKKGCIHTYKGHTRGIRTIKFSPDGRWVVTGGEDHVVKVWDLTAGKLLHDFKFHNGIIRCIDFHPQEFLLATGSADRTVNFWDLETFELIGSAGPEATGVRSTVFHPDGRTLFCGLDETLKVFSWEPIRCHDIVDMGWSTLGDLGIYEGKLLGCSYHQRRVGVWVADISQIGPYGVGVMPMNNTKVEPVNNYGEDHSVDLKEICTDVTKKIFTPDFGAKNNDTERGSAMQSNICSQSVIQEDPIYSSDAAQLITTGFRSNNPSMSYSAPQKPNSRFPSKVSTLNTSAFRVSKARQVAPSTPNRTAHSLASRDIPQSSSKLRANSSLALKKSPMTDLDTVKNKSTSKPVSTPVLVPKNSLDSERMYGSRKVNTLTDTLSRSTAFQKFNRIRQPSFSGDISDSQVSPTASRPSSSSADELGGRDSSLVFRLTANDETVIADEPDSRGIRNVAKKFERILSLEQSVGLQKNKDAAAEPPVSSSETSSIKYVRGVAVQLGRTRSLVDSWEKRERSSSSQTDSVSSLSDQAPKLSNLPTVSDEEVHTTAMETKADDDFDCEILIQGHDVFLNTVKSRLTKLQVIRHFWQRNGIKGAIDAVVKLPDLSIQVDVISVLIEKIDLFTLDIFSCLLPLLSGLLSSKTDRHATVSLELLLELVKIFGPVIFSTVSASSLVGVDLQAEQRLERCKQCYTHLQKIQQVLPLLIRKGGLLAKQAVKLNLTLKQKEGRVMKLRRRMWGTWEELILGGAVVRHGTHNWDIIADEVRIRAHSAPAHLYNPQECQSRFEGIQQEYSGNNSWYGELRKRRVAELKRELAKSEGSIGSLQTKIQTLTRERETDSNSGCNTSQTESRYPAEDADGLDSSSKDDSKDGISAGSFTEKTVRAQKNEDDENIASVSVHKNSPKMESSENTCREKLETSENTCRDKLESSKNTCKEKFGCEGLGIGLKIFKKKRGKRKRKGCNVMEGSMGCSDTLSSAPLTDREGSTEGYNQDAKLPSEDLDGPSGKDDNHLDLAAVMDSIMKEKDVSIFRSRLESQRRVRYKKLIRRHVDFRNINLRIGNCSISSSQELLRDLYLLVNNALVYYPKNSSEHKSALVLRDLVKKTFGQSSIDTPSNLSRSSSNDVGKIPNPMPQQNVTGNEEDAAGKEDDETPSPKESKVAAEKGEATPLTKTSSDKVSCKVDDVALESPAKKKRVTGRNARGGQRGGRKRRQETTTRGKKRTSR